MKTLHHFAHRAVASGLCIAFGALAGCSKTQEGGPSASAPPVSVGQDDHPTEGPHHGSLIELGNEEYHAELVHDDAAATVTVYLLDSTAKVAVPIEAMEMQINLSHDGKAEQFELAASPQADDPVGRASKFFSGNAELAEDLDHEGAQAQLVVSIAGKQYRGTIEHDHDAEEHDH